jgi:hypothetical protein
VTSPAAFDYRVYGLALRSNRRLPHLRRGDAQDPIEVRFDAEPVGDPLVAYGNRRAALRFSIDPVAGRVWVNRLGDCPAESIGSATSLLVGPILAGLLRLGGTLSLHACVVAVDSVAVAVLADRGVGKSTLAAAMARAGCAVLSDDIAAIAEQSAGAWIAETGYPRLRLHPDTIATLRDHWAAVTDAGPVGLGDAKRYLTLSTAGHAQAWRFQPAALPLGAIYELRRATDLSRPVATPLSAPERVSALLRHMRAGLLMQDTQARVEEFARICRLAATVPMRSLACPAGLEHLASVCETLVADASTPVG